MDKRSAEIAISILKEQSEQQQVDLIVSNLSRVELIETEPDPTIQRALLISLIDVLKIHGLSDAQAVDNIRGVAKNKAFLSLLDDKSQVKTIKN